MWLSSLFALLPGLLSLWLSALAPVTLSHQSVEVLDRRGERVGYLGLRPGMVPVALNDVPRELQELVLLAEDRRFNHHGGIDFLRLADATRDFVSTGELKGGASTITQQWVRLRGGFPRRWWAKPLVMALAVGLEHVTTKAALFEAYLNHLPFSHNVTGVGAAAEFYFAKPLKALSPGEHATLATLIHSPTALARPTASRELKRQRDQLLRHWPREERQLAAREEVTLNRRYPEVIAAHFLQSLAAPQQAKVQTTLDVVLQKNLTKLLREELHRLARRGVRHGAIVVLSAQSGDVLAYVGGHDFFAEDAGQIDGLRVKRQPGSILKAITYALAVDDGMNAAEILADTPGVFRSGVGVYRPRNYDENFTGPRRAREALANSLNLPAIMLLDELTPARLHLSLQELGIPLPRESDYYGVGLTLGNAEMTPLALAQAFTVFPRQGSWVKARWRKDEAVSAHTTKLKPESLWLVTDMLKDRHARMEAFGERTVFDVPFEMAAKTGTSTDYRDNWTVAWTSEHVVVTWVGNHDQRPMQRVSGITGAGPLARATMLQLYEQTLPAPFKAPLPFLVRPVCALSGMRPGPHCQHVIDEKFLHLPPSQSCDWHVEVATSCGPQKIVRYPERFQAWAFDRGLDEKSQLQKLCPQEDAQIAQTLSAGAVQVSYPLNGAVFALDPDMPRERQRLPLRLTGPRDGIEWEVDGERLGSGERDGTLDWPLERGKHVIRLIKAEAKVDEVEIFVR